MRHVYLAARYSRRIELLGYVRDLQMLSIYVTSRWLGGDHQIDDAGLSTEASTEARTRFAREDFADVMAADTIIAFTESPRSTNSRGGRHVELGIALGAGKRAIVVGPRENVFHCLPTVEWFATWPEALASLGREYDQIGAVIDAAFGQTHVPRFGGPE